MNTLKTFLLLGLLSVILVLAGQYFGGQQGMYVAFLLAAVMNLGSYWFSDKIVLAMYRAKPVTQSQAPLLAGLVEELAQKAGLPMPRLYFIDDETPNAFATGRNPQHAAVAVTTGLLRILNENELKGVLGHELAHVKNRDILIGAIAATLAGAITMLSRMAYFLGGSRNNGNRRGSPLVAMLLLILGPVAALLVQMAISRSREYAADLAGSRMAGQPLYLANGLRSLQRYQNSGSLLARHPAAAHLFIVSPLSGGGLVNLFSTHPPIAERIRRLEEMARTMA